MRLQGCSNIYMLILLLSAIAAINAQTESTGYETSSIGIDNDSNNDSNASDNDSKNDTSIDIDDNNNNNTSINTNNGNDKNSTSIDTGNGKDKNNTISISTNNGNITCEDIKNDIRNITSCIMHTKVVGTLIIQIIQLTKLFFILVPDLQSVLLNYFNYFFAFLIDALVDLSQLFQIIVKFAIPLLQLSLFVGIF